MEKSFPSSTWFWFFSAFPVSTRVAGHKTGQSYSHQIAFLGMVGVSKKMGGGVVGRQRGRVIATLVTYISGPL